MLGVVVLTEATSGILGRVTSIVKRMFTWRFAGGSVIAFIGYILSPASWWNDLFVNIPIAYIAASIASMLNPDLFAPAFASSYLMTNILGFILMHTGAEIAVKGKPRLTWLTLFKYAVVSAVYTAVAIVLVEIGIIQPLPIPHP